MIACVCCACLHWSEDLQQRYLKEPRSGCNPALWTWLRQLDVAWGLLSVDLYAKKFPLIPRSELESSAVVLDGHCVLLHKSESRKQ